MMYVTHIKIHKTNILEQVSAFFFLSHLHTITRHQTVYTEHKDTYLQ